MNTNIIGNDPIATQKKHGFVYSDIDRYRAQQKAEQYRKEGFKSQIAIRATGYFVVIEDV